MLHSIQQQVNSMHGITEDEIELNLPLKTTEDVEAFEDSLKDEDVKKKLVQVLVNNGGLNITNFVKRNMKFLFSNELARKYNLTGQKNKKPFQPLQLFQMFLTGDDPAEICGVDLVFPLCSNNARSRSVGLQFLINGAAKRNYETKQNLSKKLLEEVLSTWFGNARDRGKDSRKGRNSNAANTENNI
ncbi:uncharacterized protein LOC124818726 isoform X1 [Hydra vulgaris]|uniref:uncharacterized protein LOC124818726 isoform X1 n=1 Tax=Hydra vulgaris TaxID=6087 RepID=UPI001F5EE31A|nr:uncharacterized protein LOC124818726 isoform X1 [Hydra vulgaris]XP_047145731.1 uncharacterized protein LOC124818726 isoform X1 [Hydra vulgaris]XP_047145732.1 uncharacterized protein LOC124818726 isoform X1 [Hydra vulgaris]XP_047145733.1 uncharacterized protein LOC124818726 isoform X1 [Hydra vulgaris]XP_047145734.1 uncharacterized protein LOC124818726 isoform X1 [Hydra vulgaris]